MWTDVGFIIVSYVYGSIPFSWLIAKLKGVDLREFGNRNIGASNLTRAAGGAAGVIGGACDFSKGLLLIPIGYCVLGLEVEILCIAGIVILLGHNWSIFLKFSGGRGGTAGGSVAVGFISTPVLPWETLVVLVPLLSGYTWRNLKSRHAPTRSVPLGMLLTFVLIPVFTWLWGGDNRNILTLTFVVVLVILILRRLTADLGRDLKEKPATQSLRGILLHRLLYDRSYIGKLR